MGKVKATKPVKEEKPAVEDDDGIGNVVLPEKDLLEKRAKQAVTKKKRSDTGVVLLEGIPHGFYELQIRDYFSQFGEVRRIRVGRSKKTGNSKGYAFVEFEYPEVAQIAAEAMNNYMMFKQVLRTKYIPPAQQHPNMFKRIPMTYYRGHKLPKQRADAIVALKKTKNASKPQETIVKQNKRLVKKLRKLKTMYDKMDIEFDVDKVMPAQKVADIKEFSQAIADKKNAKLLKKKEFVEQKKKVIAERKKEQRAAAKLADVKPEKKTLPLSVAKSEKSIAKKAKVKAEKKAAADAKKSIPAPTAKAPAVTEKKKSVLSGRVEKKKKAKGAIKKESLQLAVKTLLKEKKQAQPKKAAPKVDLKPQKTKKKGNKK